VRALYRAEKSQKEREKRCD